MVSNKFESYDDSQMRAVGEVHGDAYLGDRIYHSGPRPSRVSGVGGNPLDIESYWVDRAGYQDELADRLGRCNVTEIVGTGGFGKSSLAAWAYEHRQGDFKRRVWVNFQRGQSFHSFAQYVLQEIDRPNHDPQATEATLLQDLLLRLRDANVPVKTLVVMDQLEAIAQAEDWHWFVQFLTQWAVVGKESRVVVTSWLQVLPEAPIALGGMDVAEGSVFLAREGLTGEGFGALIGLAGGHPLLLKLAATWTKLTYGARVDGQAIDFFGKLFASYGGDPRAGVEAIFGVIFGELAEGLQDLLCGVSVYRVPFGVAMAQAIGPSATIADLELLCGRGLLLRQGEGFTLHPLVAELVRGQLGVDARAVAHEAAIGYYCANFQEWDGTIESCREELEGFYHAYELGQYGRADWMLGRCYEMLNRAGQWRLLLQLYGRLTDEWQAADDAETKNLGWAWTRLGNLRRRLGDVTSAITAHKEAQTIFDRLDFAEGKSASLANLGSAYYLLSQYQRAIDFHQQSLEIAREIGNVRGEAHSYWCLNNIYQQRGRIKRAMQCRHQAYRIWQDMQLPIEAAPFPDFTKNMVKSMGDDWAEQLIASEQMLAWLFIPMGYLLFAIRTLLSPLTSLQKKLKIKPLWCWLGLLILIFTLIYWLKR